MAYPRKLLAGDEEIAFELHPAWKILVPPVLWLLVIVAVTSFLAAQVSALMEGSATGFLTAALVVLAVSLLIVLTVRPIIYWLTTQYVFTSRRIIIRTGLIARQGRDMPLSKVNDVSFSHSAFERAFNCGTLVIESASEHGQLIIANVPNVESVQREVYRLHDEDDAFRRNRFTGADPSPPAVES